LLASEMPVPIPPSRTVCMNVIEFSEPHLPLISENSAFVVFDALSNRVILVDGVEDLFPRLRWHRTRHPSPADALYRIFTDVLYKRGGVSVHLGLECVEFLFPHNVFPLV
jgi:hypothetical protein